MNYETFKTLLRFLFTFLRSYKSLKTYIRKTKIELIKVYSKETEQGREVRAYEPEYSEREPIADS